VWAFRSSEEYLLPQPTEPESIDALLAHICRLHYHRARTRLEALGLYRGQPPLLYHLHEQDGLTHSELAERLQVTPATMTKMIKRMEKAGFVQRRPDAEDQRVSRVYLTDAGRAIKAEMLAALRALGEESFAGFSPEERDLLRRFFEQIRENLIRATEEKGPF
jgi:DNA-binding MarR family transcriptional regulator